MTHNSIPPMERSSDVEIAAEVFVRLLERDPDLLRAVEAVLRRSRRTKPKSFAQVAAGMISTPEEPEPPWVTEEHRVAEITRLLTDLANPDCDRREWREATLEHFKKNYPELVEKASASTGARA
jgi:hypothetical protein